MLTKATIGTCLSVMRRYHANSQELGAVAGTKMRDAWIELMLESEDPRIEGPYRVEPLHMDIDPNTGISRMWGTGHVVREDGAFEGPVMGFAYPYSEGVDGYTASGWLTGTGAFEGLVYHYRGTFDGEEAFSEYIIFEGQVPPIG